MYHNIKKKDNKHQAVTETNPVSVGFKRRHAAVSVHYEPTGQGRRRRPGSGAKDATGGNIYLILWYILRM
jgi:hypothetical protein